MNEARRLAYLEALEIPVWRPRQAATPPIVELQVGPGASGLLLACGGQELVGTAIATDIARALRDVPAWGWPVSPGSGQPVEAWVAEQLLTTVLVFGDDLARQLLGEPLPERVGQARIVVVPRLERLAADADSRRALWRVLCSHRLSGAA